MAEATAVKGKKLPAYTVQAVRSPLARVSPCPNTAHLPLKDQHKNRKIYKTDGRIRRCKCNDCGHTWKMVLEAASEADQFLLDLSKSIDEAEPTELEGDQEPVILMPHSEAVGISKRLKEIAMGE